MILNEAQKQYIKQKKFKTYECGRGHIFAAKDYYIKKICAGNILNACPCRSGCEQIFSVRDKEELYAVIVYE